MAATFALFLFKNWPFSHAFSIKILPLLLLGNLAKSCCCLLGKLQVSFGLWAGHRNTLTSGNWKNLHHLDAPPAPCVLLFGDMQNCSFPVETLLILVLCGGGRSWGGENDGFIIISIGLVGGSRCDMIPTIFFNKNNFSIYGKCNSLWLFMTEFSP